MTGQQSKLGDDAIQRWRLRSAHALEYPSGLAGADEPTASLEYLQVKPSAGSAVCVRHVRGT